LPLLFVNCKGGTSFAQKQFVCLVGARLQWSREDGNKIVAFALPYL